MTYHLTGFESVSSPIEVLCYGVSHKVNLKAIDCSYNICVIIAPGDISCQDNSSWES